MSRTGQRTLERRVIRAAEAALDDHQSVSALDVLVGIGWLPASAVDRWRQGRVDHLEREMAVSHERVATALDLLSRWAVSRELSSSEAEYVARTRDRRPLRFSPSGDVTVYRVYRTHWLSPDLSETRRKKLVESQSRPPDLVVINALNDWTCSVCSGTGELLFMEGDGPLCLGCAEFDHLEYLPAGDAALTRRAKKASGLSAVVVRFSRSRRRYERQGLLVEEEALVAAEQECLADDEARRRRREREAERRGAEDAELKAALAREIVRLFPGCPAERVQAIARHSGARGSGRIGRSVAGRALGPEAVNLAVAAAIRHSDTPYDELLMSGVPRSAARERVQSKIDTMLDTWRTATESR
jgi:hypothetical protein